MLLSGFGTHGYNSLDEISVKTSFYGYVSIVMREEPVVGVVAFVREVCFHKKISSAG
jgi:hypothetical protein